MKIIEGLKKIKELQKKAEDLRSKIATHSAHLDYETPLYSNQKGQVSEWLQAHSDVLKEILKYRVGIQRVNLSTDVTIEIGGKAVTKTIAEWIHRRRDLANFEAKAWKALTDRGLKEGVINQSTGEPKAIKLVRCYDPIERDGKVDIYSDEPMTIDSKLEVINAITELEV